MAGAPLKNTNATRTKPWLAALERVGMQDPEKLRKIALKVYDMALEGDMQAVREIADRLDGKPMQQMEVSTPAMRDAYRDLPDDALLAIATLAHKDSEDATQH